MDPALQIARTILEGFDKHYRIFRDTSASARLRFEHKEWHELRSTNRARIDLYDIRVLEAVETVAQTYPAAAVDESLWPAIKKAYIALLYDHKQPECAETFFNSVASKVLHRNYFNNEYIFSRPAVAAEHIESDQQTYRCYYPLKTGLRRMMFGIFQDFDLAVPLANPRLSVRNLLEAFRSWIPATTKLEPNFHLQVLSSLFYRNKAAYIVGRVINGRHKSLFAIPLRFEPKSGVGILVDAFVHEHEQLANLFSVAHAYFMVDMEVPSAWVMFIHEALPDKSKAELYTAVGLQKQGKTLFFRDLNFHLKHSADSFVVAPGVRGMVMLVFTLPSFPYVFKVIRDKFQPPKDTSRQLVMEKYRLVKRHERVGRLADTLEFSNVAFPLDRFEPELLEEMKRLIPSTMEIQGNQLVIKHLYIEQRMTPLDIYMREANEDQLKHAVREFGQSLRDLAASNIFPGDLLPKNFGVTAYGKVVFYDYDEVTYLTECSFREVPTARHDEDEMRAEPWYSVGAHDVFPQEFVSFLFSDERARKLFREMHSDLLTPQYWAKVQENVRKKVEVDLFPYPESIRFNYGSRASEPATASL